MLFKKKNQNQIKDERIEKESNKVMAAVYWLFLAGLLASLVTKLVLGEPWYNFILEIVCIVPSLGYALVKRSSNSVLFLKEKDEALVTIRNGIMAKAFNIALNILITGELIYMFFVIGALDVLKPEDVEWCIEETWLLVYLAIWFVPSLIVTIFTIKNGWMVWGSKKRETTGKKNFAKSTAIGALFFGLMMGVVEVLENGFSIKALIITFGTGAMWGILFYFMMLATIKISEKNADKAVKKQEENSEE